MKVDVSKGFELGSYHYKVLQSNEVEKGLEGDNAYGKCSNLHRQILMTKNFSPDQFCNTFIHECLEAVNNIYCNNNMKHDLLSNTGNGLSQILKSLGISFYYGGNNGNK